VSGAPVARTITVDATKFLLLKQPSADGTVRTTISAGPGAITSTPDFVGVRVVASQGTGDLGSAPAQADGSAAVFQLPQAVTQVSLRVQDDSGHTVAVTGYPERVVMSFAGKSIAGNSNPIAAYDAATGTSSLFDPAAWINAGLTELPASSPITNNLATPAAYNGLSSIDGISSVTALPPQPIVDGPVGWERITSAATATAAGLEPSPRSGAAIAASFFGLQVGNTSYNYILYGGLDAGGALADATPTIYAFSQNTGAGWTTVPINVSTSASPFPSRFFSSAFGVDAPVTRANASMGPAASFAPGTVGATNLNYSFFIAGGKDANGVMTNKVYAFGDRVTTTNGNKFTGWWDESVEFGATARLAVPNAGMASASLLNIPVSQGTAAAPSSYAGMVLVGGEGNSAGAVNDASGCQFVTSTSFGTPSTFQVSSCTVDPSAVNANAFTTLTGGIGFRTGVALTNTDIGFAEGATVYLFGGSRSGATTPSLNGLQNDIWKGTISVVCSPANASNAPPPCTGAAPTASTQITWQLIPTAGTAPASKPSARAGAAIAFGDSRKLVVYGGTDAAGVVSDVWELDLSPATAPLGGFLWRKMSIEPNPAIAPVVRSKAIMLGGTTSGSAFYGSAPTTLLFGGTAGTTLTNDVWALSRQGAPRLLIAAPTGISSRAQATNAKLSIAAAGTLAVNVGRFGIVAPNLLYGWNGSAWQFLGAPGITGNIFVSPQNALSYVQPDGKVYLMLMSRVRSTTGSAATTSVQLDGLEVALDFR
jgi:hypothetical protein